MNFFLRSVSYILHPILMPLIGAIIYFNSAPRFIPESIIKAKLMGLIIITILIPIIFSFFIKNLGAPLLLAHSKSHKMQLPCSLLR